MRSWGCGGGDGRLGMSGWLLLWFKPSCSNLSISQGPPKSLTTHHSKNASIQCGGTTPEIKRRCLLSAATVVVVVVVVAVVI